MNPGSLWYTHEMEYYKAMKKNATRHTMEESHREHSESKKPVTKINSLSDSIYLLFQNR